VSPVGQLRRALRDFLDQAGTDPRYKGVAQDVHQLEASLGQADLNTPEAGPPPGARASGQNRTSGGQSPPSPGMRAAGASSPNSAKGQGSNLAAFLKKRKAAG
jgi:hypothetical protein